jgi:hypothetical protein
MECLAVLGSDLTKCPPHKPLQADTRFRCSAFRDDVSPDQFVVWLARLHRNQPASRLSHRPLLSRSATRHRQEPSHSKAALPPASGLEQRAPLQYPYQ